MITTKQKRKKKEKKKVIRKGTNKKITAIKYKFRI